MSLGDGTSKKPNKHHNTCSKIRVSDSKSVKATKPLTQGDVEDR